MTASFIAQPQSLIESPKVPDLLNLGTEKVKIRSLLNKIGEYNTIGLVGKHGVGKSTLLNSVIEETKTQFEWVIFDAWQFPDKSDLWDGFCLKTAEHFDLLEGMREKLDGENPHEISGNGLTKLKPFNGWGDLLRGTPVNRTYQFFQLLKIVIDNSKKPVVFVIEDADRAGTPGLRFIETLHYFLSETIFNQIVTSFVLIGSQAYADDLSSYAKSLDHLHFFEPKHKSLENFFNNTINLSVFEKRSLPASQLSDFFLYLMEKYDYFNLRLIKSIMRRSDLLYGKLVQDGHKPDPRLAILAETSHFVTTNDKLGSQKIYTAIKDTGVINHQPFTALATAIHANERSIFTTDGRLISYSPSSITLLDAKINMKAEIWQTNSFEKGTFSKKYYFDLPEEN